jgi:trimeric autotransporter adhesin
VALSVDGNVAFSLDNHARYGDGFESTSSGAFSLRALVVDQVLRRVAAASHGGTFAGRRLVGRVDLAHVGIAGHSRGGEGVIDGAAQGVFSGGPYHLSALLGIAPTNFDLLAPPDVPFATLLGYCDGDVFNLGGLAYYDAATRDPNRVSPAYAQVLLGANHNFFDTAWTFQDEAFGTPYCAHRAIGRSRLTARRQRAAAIRFARAFFRRHLSHGGLSSVLAASGTAPTSIARAPVTTSFQAGRTQRRALDVPADASVNAVGGAVRGTALGTLDMTPPDLRNLPSRPWSPHHLLARTLGANGVVSEALPGAAADARSFRTLTFRAAADPRVVPARRRDLQVSLIDAAGHRATVSLTSEAALRTPPASHGGQKAILGTVRIALTRFRGVDRGHVARIELRAPGSGRLLLADLAFQR